MSAQVESHFLSLLKQINDGVQIFEPFLRTPEKMQEFQDTVARLHEMEDLRLIRKLFVQTRTYRSVESIDFVMVVGGLTEEGQRLLKQ
jgi:hypothetical protein